MPKLKLTETVLRDGQQSLAGARMTTADMLPILPTMDKIGYYSAEVWGGATFDMCLRQLHEDPWARLRAIRSSMSHTKLQMLLRGQNLVGYRNYPDDIVQYFVQKSVANGVDILRILDPLNDPRNVETAIRAAKKEGALVQGALCYTTSPVHSTESYLDYAKQLLSLGADSICIKDMAGLLRPYEAYQLIKALRAAYPSLSIQLHTHETTGMAAMTILKAVEVGVDIIDTAISPFACGASLSATESVVNAFLNTPYAPEVDTHALAQTTEYFALLRNRYTKSGMMYRHFLKVDTESLKHQMPGGVYSRLLAQACNYRDENLINKVFEEVPRVRADAGYVPLITPISQVIGTQAFYNVTEGKRYKKVTDEFKALIGGHYGKTPAPIDTEFQRMILGDEIPITHRPADTLEGQVEHYRTVVAPYAEQEEDLLTLALFDNVAINFFEWRKNQKYKLDSRAVRKTGTHPV